MHEWALADAIVATVVAELAKSGAEGVRNVGVLLGELQAIDREILEFALRSLCEAQGIDPAVFHLETEEAAFKCRACGREWSLREDPNLADDQREAIHFLPESAHAFIRCPGCGSVDFGVEKGRGVKLSCIEWEARR